MATHHVVQRKEKLRRCVDAGRAMEMSTVLDATPECGSQVGGDIDRHANRLFLSCRELLIAGQDGALPRTGEANDVRWGTIRVHIIGHGNRVTTKAHGNWSNYGTSWSKLLAPFEE